MPHRQENHAEPLLAQHGAKGARRPARAAPAEAEPRQRAKYVQAVQAARAAFDDMATISGMTVQAGPRWADRTPLPGLPPLVARTVSMGFGHRDEPPPGQVRGPDRSARRLQLSADSQI
jgi:hypothetical protein